MNDELADRLQALEAERLRPVPPPKAPRLRPITRAVAEEHLETLRHATRPRTYGRRPAGAQ